MTGLMGWSTEAKTGKRKGLNVIANSLEIVETKGERLYKKTAPGCRSPLSTARG
jgi:hypothetical protein